MEYTVNMKIDGRLVVNVDADSPEDSKEKAIEAFMEADNFSDMEFVDANPVSCEDENGVYTNFDA